MSDQPDVETLCDKHSTHKRQTSVPQV